MVMVRRGVRLIGDGGEHSVGFGLALLHVAH